MTARPLGDRLAEWKDLAEEEMVRALDRDRLDPREPCLELPEVVDGAVAVRRAGDHERRHAPPFEAAEVVHRERWRDQDHAGDPRVAAADERRNSGAERVARERERPAAHRLRQSSERRYRVFLLADAPRVASGPAAHSPEIEADGRDARPRQRF